MSIKVLHQIPKGIRLNYTSIFAVCFCSTIITGGIKLNKKKLYHASVSQTVGLTKIWLPEFPEFNDTRTLVTTNNGDILSYGGGSQLCLVLKNGSWVEHSTMNIYRLGAVGITMPEGIYVFGGILSANTSEFLPNDATIWQEGPDVPYTYSSLTSFGSNFLKRMAMLPFDSDYKAKGHAISKTELILIYEDHIIKAYDYDNH